MNIYGASGHAKVISDIFRSRNFQISRVFDDDPSILNFAGMEVYHNPDAEILKDTSTIISIGDNCARKKVALNFKGAICPAVSHTSAIISSSATVGEGTVIMANASVNSETTIGKHCIINTGATVEHECVLQDFVHVSPNAALAGNVSVGEGAHIGVGAAIIPGIKIGKWSTIGAGAVVIEDVPDYAVVVGNPGKIIKYKDS